MVWRGVGWGWRDRLLVGGCARVVGGEGELEVDSGNLP